MRRVNFNDEKFQDVTVKGISCKFSDMRIDRDTVPDGLYLYEVAGDDDSGGEPARVKEAILVNFIGTLITAIELPLGEDGVLWLEENDYEWVW